MRERLTHNGCETRYGFTCFGQSCLCGYACCIEDDFQAHDCPVASANSTFYLFIALASFAVFGVLILEKLL